MSKFFCYFWGGDIQKNFKKNMKEDRSTFFLSRYFNFVKRFELWLKDGDPVPKTHYKSMAIMTALLVIGLPTFFVFILAAAKIAFYEHIRSVSSLGVVSFLTLTPGLYVLWLTICCWRRVDGYKWGMIPFFD